MTKQPHSKHVNRLHPPANALAEMLARAFNAIREQTGNKSDASPTPEGRPHPARRCRAQKCGCNAKSTPNPPQTLLMHFDKESHSWRFHPRGKHAQ